MLALGRFFSGPRLGWLLASLQDPSVYHPFRDHSSCLIQPPQQLDHTQPEGSLLIFEATTDPDPRPPLRFCSCPSGQPAGQTYEKRVESEAEMCLLPRWCRSPNSMTDLGVQCPTRPSPCPPSRGTAVKSVVLQQRYWVKHELGRGRG